MVLEFQIRKPHFARPEGDSHIVVTWWSHSDIVSGWKRDWLQNSAQIQSCLGHSKTQEGFVNNSCHWVPCA